MENTQLFAAALFDEATNDWVGRIAAELAARGLHDTQTPGLPMHFTLGSSPPNEKAEAVDRLAKVCRQTDSFEICLSHVGVFGQKVIFAAPNWNRELIDLRDQLFPDEPLSGAHRWSAHATLFMGEPEYVLWALPIVTELFQPLTAKIVNVSMFEFPPPRFVASEQLR